MYGIRYLFVAALIIALLIGCTADSRKNDEPKEADTLYKTEPYYRGNNHAQEPLEYIPEGVLNPKVFSGIKADAWYNGSHCISFRKPPLYVEFASNRLDFQEIRGVDWKWYNQNFFWGQSFENTNITCDISTGKIYDNEYWASDNSNVNFLENNVGALLCHWQGHKHRKESTRIRYDGYRVLLFDQFADLLPYQLRFDYGKIMEFIDDEVTTSYLDEYMIIGLTYDTQKERYIAIYAINARLFMDEPLEWEAANNKRTIGVAIFDCNGNQLERYNLPYITYPQFTSHKLSLAPNGSSRNPDLLLIEDDMLLIIPKEADEISNVIMKYNGTSTTAPVLLNLKTRETTLWTHEEMASFLAHSEKYEGELKDAWGNGEIWSVREERPPMPYEMLWEETNKGESVTLVRMLGEEKALFALPGKVSTQIWAQTEDGTVHAIVTVGGQAEDVA